MEFQTRLNAQAENGFWFLGDDEFTDGAVVFEDGPNKVAFLLSNYDGRPAYTCMRLEHVDVPGQFQRPVALRATRWPGFELASATLGKLIVRDGEAFITTLDERGLPTEVSIAPYVGTTEHFADYGYCWALVRNEGKPGDDEEVEYRPTSLQSWLNAWRAPSDCADGDNELELEIAIPI